MTQAGGNGHKPDVDSDDITVYEPASLPESGEPIGWYETDPKGEEGEITPNLPPELDDDTESSN
jgi:hypothetical protein